jgi:glycosyltransferase involved in cell wall biosynthesis
VNVVVVTVAHRGDDARIVHRQIRSLLEANHSVTLIAPDPGDGRSQDPPGLERIAVRRAVGRRRVAAWRDARRAARRFTRIADVVIVHDPELVPAIGIGRWRRTQLVWDVHEDFVASVSDRRWIPRPLRPIVRRGLLLLEAVAKRRFHVILAEDSYQARFPSAPVVPNSTWVGQEPAAVDVGNPRVVYVGRLSRSRGVSTLVSLGEELTSRGGPRLVLVGPADADVAAVLDDAVRRGVLEWRGPLPNPEAMAIVRGAVAGLSLLSNHPNYVHSRPTKIVEYMAQGTPAISTPLPLAVEMIGASGAGVIAAHWFGPELVAEVADAVMAYMSSPALRGAHGQAGHEYVRRSLSWNADGATFVSLIEEFSRGSSR